MPKKENERVPNFHEPICGAEMLHPEQCKTCIFRDKTTVKLDGVTIQVGATKSVCAIFEYPDKKPMGVMKNTDECDFYEKE